MHVNETSCELVMIVGICVCDSVSLLLLPLQQTAQLKEFL